MMLSEERVVFHHEISVALGHWTTVEIAMYAVMCNCVDQKDHRLIGRGLFSIENFRSRAAFVDRLMRQRFTGERIETWAKLFERLQGAAANRNKLVHQVMEEMPEAVEGRRMALVPWLPKRNKFHTEAPQHPPGSLCVSDIVSMGRDFATLTYDLLHLNWKLGGQVARPQRSGELIDRQPTIQQIRNRIASALGHPPKSHRRES